MHKINNQWARQISGKLESMYITKGTDYSLRALMLLALQSDEELLSIEEISQQLKVSRAHLMKIINQLAALDFVETIRGRNGGVRLHYHPSEINIGDVFRQLEEITRIVDCSDGPCLFQGSCALSVAFDKASEAFLQTLDGYTLADLVKRRGHLQRLVLNRQVGQG